MEAKKSASGSPADEKTPETAFFLLRTIATTSVVQKVETSLLW